MSLIPAVTSGSLWVCGQSGLYSKFQDYIEKSCLKKIKIKKPTIIKKIFFERALRGDQGSYLTWLLGSPLVDI